MLVAVPALDGGAMLLADSTMVVMCLFDGVAKDCLLLPVLPFMNPDVQALACRKCHCAMLVVL